MNIKRFSKILAVVLAFVLCFAMAMPAFAAGTIYTGMTGDADSFKTTFDKYLVMDKGASVPAAEFTFTIAPGKGATAGNGTVAILPGVMTPTVGKAVFASNTGTNTTLQTGDEVTFNSATQKYAKQLVTVDFTGVQFTEPGIYRYVISENSCSVKGIVIDANPRYLDVYVEDATGIDGVKKLTIAGYVLHTVANASVAAGTGMGAAESQTYVKSKGFTNQYIAHDLTFSKAVDGNQASRDKYFAFTVKIEGALPTTSYNVNINNADAISGTNSATIAANAGKTNATAITTDGNGNAEVTFYLQHGQSITIEGLTDGTVWTITENEEDYKASVSVNKGTSTDANHATSDNAATVEVKEGITADTTVDFTNSRAGVVPTGVFLTVAPFAIILFVGIAGVAMVLLKKKRAYAE